MTVTSVLKDPGALTMTITAEFDAPVERVWQLWADPRQLERWWGRMTIESTFPSREAMDQLVAMGMDEGLSAAIGQIDDILRSGAVA